MWRYFVDFSVRNPLCWLRQGKYRFFFFFLVKGVGVWEPGMRESHNVRCITGRQPCRVSERGGVPGRVGLGDLSLAPNQLNLVTR